MKRNGKIGLILLAVLLVMGAGLIALPRAGRQIREESRGAIREAVVRSAMECYAVEGVYPPSLEYLQQHYGLRLNHRDFIVSYEVFASNQPPSVQVMVKGEG